MTMVATQEATDQIIAYIMRHGGADRTWYAGISADANQTLRDDHQVPEIRSDWVYRICSSDAAARNVEKALINLGCDGDRGGGDHSSVQVYAYKKTSATKP